MKLDMDLSKMNMKGVYILGRYPDRDWHRVFISSIILALIMGVWSIWFFIGLQESAPDDSGGGSNVGTIHTQRDQLSSLVQAYQAKSALHQQLIDQSK